MAQSTLKNSEKAHSQSVVDTSDDTAPLFESWNSWYLLVVVVNVIVLTLIFFYFKSI